MKALRMLAMAAVSAAYGPAQDMVIDATGRAQATPDLYYLLMKMEQSSARASDAAAEGERALKEFLAAAGALEIPGLKWRVVSNVFTPAEMPGSQGVVYTRNVIFTLPHTVSLPDRDSIFARLQDLGAKFNSHCVTCIGSG